MNREVNVVALVRGDEHYIFMFDEANRTETLRMLGRYAADPQLSFTWYDAAMLSQRVRELMPAKSVQPASALSPSKPSPSSASRAHANEPKTKNPSPRFRLP
jgi:hypothetical protein